MNSKNDILIIGSGLGGLVTGNILGRKGFKVTILEKNPVAGGCLQTFKRNGVHFDTGIHYIGGFGKGQVLDRLFRYLGLVPGLKIRELDKEGFDRYRIGPDEYVYPVGYDRFKSKALSYFPDEEEAIDKYIEIVREISRSVSLYNLEPTHFDLQAFYSKFNYGNVMDCISSLTKNQKLQNYFSAINSLYAGTPESSFMYIHALVTNHYIEGAYRFINGSQQVADKLIEKLESYGGEVILNKKAVKFNFDDKEISSVVTSSGEEFTAKKYISDIHPYYLLEMIEPGKVRETYRKRIQSLNNTMSCFALYVVLKEGTVPHMNYNFYYGPEGIVWGVSHYDPAKFPRGIALYPVADSRDDKFCYGFTVFAYMDYDEVAQWENTTIRKRGPEYEAFKAYKAQKMLDQLEEAMPGMKNNIKSYTASTPLTLKDYIGTYRGAAYGILRDCRDPFESMLFPRTKVPNLYLTGQNINMHGFMGVSIGALLTCAEFIDLNELLEEINNV